MYVLVTDDAAHHKTDLESLAGDLRALAEDPSTPLAPLGNGQRVFGPYQTYEEGKIAAITLPYECDYWVVEVESI